MSTWNKDISQSLADAVTSVLTGAINEDSKAKQNAMMKKGKGEPANQTKGKNELPEENGKKKSQLDPVGKEDSDVDNDGDSDSSDEYLMKRRKAISKSIRNTSKTGKKVALNGKKEKVTINPVMGEEFENLDEAKNKTERPDPSMKRFLSIKKQRDRLLAKGELDKRDSDRLRHIKKEIKSRSAYMKTNEDIEQVDELNVKTKIRAVAARNQQAGGIEQDELEYGTGGLNKAEKLRAKAKKMRAMIAKKHGEQAAKGADNLSRRKEGKDYDTPAGRKRMNPKATAADRARQAEADKRRIAKTEAGLKARRERIAREKAQRNEEFDRIDELKVSTKIRAAAQRAADASGDRADARWGGYGAEDSERSAIKNQRSADKMRKQIAKKHGDRAAQGVDNLANIRAGKKMSHSRVRNSQKPDSLANRPSTSISKSGERKGKITRASAERLKSAIRNRSKQRNEEFQEERAAIREAIEHSFDTVFQYSNAEEEAFRNDWMEEFDSIVSGTEPSAYLDPLQRRVYYIEGLSPQQAADRYLTHIRPNRAFAGGEYKASSRGGDVYASSQQQGQGPSRVHHAKFRGNYKTEY